MRAAQIADLSGAYGTIQHEIIWAKVAHYGITRLYGTSMIFRDGRMVPDAQALAPATRTYVNGKGIEYGIVRDPTWTQLDAAGLATALEQDLRSLGFAAAGQPGASGQCAVLADAEVHTFDIAAFLTAWRKLRPSRETGWTIEGFQGGRITGGQVATITNDKNLIVYPQTYRGSMYPQAADAVRMDLETNPDGTWLLPRERIKLVYDGLNGAPDRMDGIIYTLERLP